MPPTSAMKSQMEICAIHANNKMLATSFKTSSSQTKFQRKAELVDDYLDLDLERDLERDRERRREALSWLRDTVS